VVLVILGLLGGLVGPQVLGYVGTSKSKAARLQVEQLQAALDLYRLDTRGYPTTEQGLAVLVKAPAGVQGWSGPYLAKNEVPADPWGKPYQYRSPGRHGKFDLYSLGADEREGGDGEAQDITNYER